MHPKYLKIRKLILKNMSFSEFSVNDISIRTIKQTLQQFIHCSCPIYILYCFVHFDYLLMLFILQFNTCNRCLLTSQKGLTKISIWCEYSITNLLMLSPHIVLRYVRFQTWEAILPRLCNNLKYSSDKLRVQNE